MNDKKGREFVHGQKLYIKQPVKQEVTFEYYSSYAGFAVVRDENTKEKYGVNVSNLEPQNG